MQQAPEITPFNRCDCLPDAHHMGPKETGADSTRERRALSKPNSPSLNLWGNLIAIEPLFASEFHSRTNRSTDCPPAH